MFVLQSLFYVQGTILYNMCEDYIRAYTHTCIQIHNIRYIFMKSIDFCHLFACQFFAELISSTLKMETICSSETSVDTKMTTRCCYSL
jgi:hypothetical protein